MHLIGMTVWQSRTTARMSHMLAQSHSDGLTFEEKGCIMKLHFIMYTGVPLSQVFSKRDHRTCSERIVPVVGKRRRSYC